MIDGRAPGRVGSELLEVGLDASILREMQAPLKQRYRDEPARAITALEATGTFDEDGITCTVQSWAGPIRAGLHPATGGDGSDTCSADILLWSLLACAGVTLRSVATALGIDIRSATLRGQGEFDARGSLGVSRDTPVGVRNLRLEAELDADADDEAIARLTTATERYCVWRKAWRSSRP